MRGLDGADDLELLGCNVSHSPALEGALGQRLLELARFGSEPRCLIGGRLAGGVASEALLVGFKELRGPSVVEALDDSLRQCEASPRDDAAERRCCPRRANLRGLRGFAHRPRATARWRVECPGQSPAHCAEPTCCAVSSCPPWGYDEPKTLSDTTTSRRSPDGEQFVGLPAFAKSA